MQRSSHVKELEKEEAEKQQQIDDEHWVIDIPDIQEKQ